MWAGLWGIWRPSKRQHLPQNVASGKFKVLEVLFLASIASENFYGAALSAFARYHEWRVVIKLNCRDKSVAGDAGMALWHFWAKRMHFMPKSAWTTIGLPVSPVFQRISFQVLWTCRLRLFWRWAGIRCGTGCLVLPRHAPLSSTSPRPKTNCLWYVYCGTFMHNHKIWAGMRTWTHNLTHTRTHSSRVRWITPLGSQETSFFLASYLARCKWGRCKTRTTWE